MKNLFLQSLLTEMRDKRVSFQIWNGDLFVCNRAKMKKGTSVDALAEMLSNHDYLHFRIFEDTDALLPMSTISVKFKPIFKYDIFDKNGNRFASDWSIRFTLEACGSLTARKH